MKIDLLCNDGSPIGVTMKSVTGEGGRIGVGGAELAMLTLCELLHNKGHQVTVYNGGDPAGSVFGHAPVDGFHPSHDRDILIVFRSPNDRVNKKTKGKKIWWSCDQYTVGDFAGFAQRVDEVVGISPFHADYFKNAYNITNMKVIDIPIRTWEYETRGKQLNSCIFTSVPDRGLLELVPIWDLITQKVPDASLTITSDWSLWTGADVSSYVQSYRLAWAGKKNVRYLSAVTRDRLIAEQSTAEFHLYPCVYDELFCISVAESQVAGAYPVTSEIGAVKTTNRFGTKIPGSPTSSQFVHDFAEKVIEMMQSDSRPNIEAEAKAEFDHNRVLEEWEKLFNG